MITGIPGLYLHPCYYTINLFQVQIDSITDNEKVMNYKRFGTDNEMQQLFAGEAESMQVRSDRSPQLHDPSGQAHWPPQHSSLGRLTSEGAVGYIATFVGSKPVFRLLGGAGSVAARAKNWSMMLVNAFALGAS